MRLFLPLFLLFSAGHLFGGLIIPPGQIVAAGVSNSPNFDWIQTNILNNPSYFEDESNFFNGRNIVYNPGNSDQAFLNAKKVTPVAKDNGRVRKQAVIRDAGLDNYANFGQAQSFTVRNGQSFTGIGVDTGNGNEKFEITGGSHSGSEVNVEISVRSKSEKESYGHHKKQPNGNDDHTNDKLISHSPLVGNVIRLHGMGIQEASADGRVKTNPFALAATYTQEDFDATYSLTELEELISGCLFLGWLNTAVDGDPDTISGGDRWVHAVQGNFDNMPDNPNRHNQYGVIGTAYIGTLEDYLAGTETSIAGLSKAAGEMRVGDHGGDPETNTVWAILDHNSDFAVVPELSTYALFSGLFALIVVYFRKK